jgi:hypothetical protein
MPHPHIHDTSAAIRETVASCLDRLKEILAARANAIPNLGPEQYGLELAVDDARVAAFWVRRMRDFTESAGIAEGGYAERWAPDLLPWLNSVIEVAVHTNFYFRRRKANRGADEAARLLATARALLAEAPK